MKPMVKKQIYIGVFLVALATLMYEILITRIFSVTMWYHFAFLAISIALLGMTVGAIAVFLAPSYFGKKKINLRLATSAFLFALSIIIIFLIQINIPFEVGSPTNNLYLFVLTFLVTPVPFFFSGVCITLALTKFPIQISKLYASDLLGASLGCMLLIFTLNFIDALSAVILVALVANISAVFFAQAEGKKGLLKLTIFASAAVALFWSGNVYLAANQRSFLRLKFAKGLRETPPLYEKWNSYSRVTVTGVIKGQEENCCPGLSSVYPPDKEISNMDMTIDASAYTPLIAFDGDIEDLEFLKYDITNLAHYIRDNAAVLVVGSGGGKDILSALAFGQDSIVGVEINNAIIEAVNEKFGDFTGHLDSYPNVTFVNDEARSYIASQEEKFDVIQISLIDTWAATAAGAFVLSENALYTSEAWEIFFEKLGEEGVLSITRWYFEDKPAEMYRLVSLATFSLGEIGVTNAKDHVVVVKRIWDTGEVSRDIPEGIGVATLLVSKAPFSPKDIETLEEISKKMRFDIVVIPTSATNPFFDKILSGHDPADLSETLKVNITPPTDNSPFFFNMLRLRDAFNTDLVVQGMNSFNLAAVSVLATSLIIVTILTLLFIFVPLIYGAKKVSIKAFLPIFIFFASIGFGFMLVEISQIQRLTIFLGHPTYSLSVVLFSLLLSSGLGSFSTRRIKLSATRVRDSADARIVLLLFALVAFGLLTPSAINSFEGAETYIRILVAVGLLFPLGFFMGAGFPIGIKLATQKTKSLTPWLWGVNGATSVFASVFAVALALSFGISSSYWSGFTFYAAAFAAYLWMSYQNKAR